ncbi:MAG: GTPase domain-containing protein [Granulosicoccus sp.]
MRFTPTTTNALWYLLLVVVLPACSLLIAGFVYLWQQDKLPAVLVTWLAITAASYMLFIKLPAMRLARANKAEIGEQPASDNGFVDTLPIQLDPQAGWTDHDRAIWQLASSTIDAELESRPDWQKLPDLALQHIATVAVHYHGYKSNARFRFTLPEALLVVSVASDRYRTLVMQQVPFAERISVASLVSLYERQSQLKSSLSWLNRFRRTARLANPVAAAVGELRDQITGRVLGQASESLQTDLKRLLLQEFVQVSIDLYSGRLKVSDSELASYRSTAETSDQQRMAQAAEPLRVVLLGQVSSGKSSLINALIESLAAETDILPTTDKTTVHSLTVTGDHCLHLVDTSGIDGSVKGQKLLAEMASDADMILWLARANQPGRAPDQAVLNDLNVCFSQQPERRQGPIALVLTHVDQLPPRNEWSPPYDLDSDNRKAINIRLALDSARDQIGLAKDMPVIPICLSTNREHYNVEAVAAQIMLLAEQATLTQFNRRRVKAANITISWTERWNQMVKLGRAAGKAVNWRK